VQDRDAVGELLGLHEVLGGEQHGHAVPLRQAGHGGPELVPAAWVEAGRRLVEEEQLGPGDQAGRQVKAAAHAAGVGLHQAAAGVVEVELRQELVCAVPSRAARQMPQPPHHLQVLLAGQHVVDGRVLAGEADRAPDADWVGEQVVPGDGGGARVRAEQCGQDADQRGLARAILAEEGDDLALGDRQVNAVENLLVPESLADAQGFNCVCHTLKVCAIHSFVKSWLDPGSASAPMSPPRGGRRTVKQRP